MNRAQYASLGIQLGLTYTEIFDVTPGELFDLAALRRKGKKRMEDD